MSKQNVLDEIFTECWKVGIIHSNVLIQDEMTSMWELLTYLPYQNNCHSLKKQTISLFTASNYTNQLNIPLQKLYPLKMKNLHQCPIFVATFPIEPFVFVPSTSIQWWDSKEEDFSGIEVTLINMIAEKLNFTANYFIPNTTEKGLARGNLYPNGTATGSYKAVNF